MVTRIITGDIAGEGMVSLGLGVVAGPEGDGGGGFMEGFSSGGSFREGKRDGGLYGGVLELWWNKWR